MYISPNEVKHIKRKKNSYEWVITPLFFFFTTKRRRRNE